MRTVRSNSAATRARRLTAAGCVALALAGGGALALRRAGAARSASSPKMEATTSPEASRRFHLGEQRRWALTFEAGIADGRAAPPNMALSGTWVVTVVGARDSEYDVACEIEAPHVGGPAPAGAEKEVADLERRMARRFFVTYRADGAALRVHFPKDLDPGTRNLLQTIATSTQLVRPAAPAAQWTAVERDGAGDYLAAYHETAPGRITKTKLKYLNTEGASAAQHDARPTGVEVAIASSTRHLTLDASGALAAFDGGDTTRIDLPLSGGGIAMRVSERLADLKVLRADDLVGELARAGELDEGPIVTHAPSAEESRRRADGELVAGATFDELFTAARAADSDARARARLAAWLRLHPESTAAVSDALLAARGGAVKALAQALGQAGTPSAQAALCAAARQAALPAEARADALSALVLAQRPTAETTRDVRALLDEPDPKVRKAARYLTGTVARALRAAGDGAADAVDADLAAREAAARGTTGQLDARLELLAGLGNSAGPTLLPPLRAAAADPSSAVRAAAARALRLYDDETVKALLARLIEKDPDGGVRAAAIFAATFGDAIEPYVDALTAVSLHDGVEFVRADAVTALARHRDAAPTIPTTLAQVASADPKPGIRRLAREALAAR